MNSSQSKNNQQPPEKTNGFFSIFSPKKPQQTSIRIGIWGTVGVGKTIYLANVSSG
jgi:predicted ATPase